MPIKLEVDSVATLQALANELAARHVPCAQQPANAPQTFADSLGLVPSVSRAMFVGDLDNADGMAIRKESGRDFYAFNIFDHDRSTNVTRELDVSVSANLLPALDRCQLDGTRVCRVRVTIEVLP